MRMRSFQSTYEELKRKTESGRGEAGVSFQSTYEELKPASIPGSPGVSAGFQSTYEELKPEKEKLLGDQFDEFLVYL